MVPTRTRSTPAGSGSGDVGRDQGHRGAAGDGGAGEGVPLLAGGAVAEEAHRVERLPGAAGGDHDLPAGQVERRRRASSASATAKISAGSGSRPLPVSAPVSRPTAGSSTTAAPAQRRDVGHGGRVLPHLGVHRRREDHRAARGEQRVGEQVVGQAVRGLGQQVGGGRRDHDEVGRLADPDVRHLVHVVQTSVGDRLAGQGGPGRRADEAQRGRGGHDPDRWPDSVNRRSSSQAL